MKTIIIGGVAGGATAAARLRRLDEFAEIILFERGGYISFANCGLPYYIGGAIKDKKELAIQTPQSFRARFNIDVRAFNEVLKINREKKTVAVKNLKSGEEYEESYDALILSPGAAPVTPPVPGIKNDRTFALRTIPDTYAIKEFIEQKRPKSAVVMGGGAIGIEMAENLKGLGLDLTIVELSNQIIAPLDFEMACMVSEHLRANGAELILGAGVKAVRDIGGSLKITLDGGGEIETDMLLVSAGVMPESKLAVESGLKVNSRGFIVTDKYMRTSDPDIYAVGDAAEITELITGTKTNALLAGPANKQARIAADNVCGAKTEYAGTLRSSILKAFDLTAASAGLNEKTAKELGVKYDKSFTVSPNRAGYYPGGFNIVIKTLFDPDTGKILGAQVVGKEGSDKRCDVLAAAIRLGATAYDLTKLELCYAPPFSSAKDPVNMAGFVIENILTGKVKNFHWHDIENINKENATLLDVREEPEFARGAIPGFINIPLDGLRARIDEIDKTKPVYVMCQVGLRGYLASRVLTQRGFDVYNLSGGYAVWNAARVGLDYLRK